MLWLAVKRADIKIRDGLSPINPNGDTQKAGSTLPANFQRLLLKG